MASISIGFYWKPEKKTDDISLLKKKMVTQGIGENLKPGVHALHARGSGSITNATLSFGTFRSKLSEILQE